MRYAIIYSSKTGNTKRLADTIHAMFETETCGFLGTAKEAVEKEISQQDYDIMFVGSWTDKGTCDEEMQTFLKSLVNQKLFIFGTCGFGGAPAYFQQILERMQQNITASCSVLGTYMCQGKMPMSVRSRYERMLAENPGDQRMLQFIENFDRAFSHPDEDDLEQLREKIKAVL